MTEAKGNSRCEACGRPHSDRGQRLNEKTLGFVKEELEAQEAVGSRRFATALRMILEWHGPAS